jgi:hypothetical protein
MVALMGCQAVVRSVGYSAAVMATPKADWKACS